MADQTVPPLPERAEIVSTAALYNTQVSLYRNAMAFGGWRNPSTIWSQMVRNDANTMLFYRELEEKDTDVANALDTLKEEILERAWSIQPANDSSQAADVAGFIQMQLDSVANMDEVLDNMLDAMGYGFSVQEILFDTSMGQASLQNIKDCPQELFLFGNRYDPQIGPLQFLTSPYASSGEPVPEEKFLVYSHRPRSRDRMGRPLLRSVFWASWFKRNMQRLWMRYAEKGPGTAVVRYNDANNAQERQLAAELAQSIIDEVAVGVPMNFDYDKDLLTIARSMDPAVYEHFYGSMQKEIIRRILGETLTTFGSEDGRGSQAQGKTHAGTLDTKAIRGCKALGSVLNWQLVRPLVLWNFGPAAPMPKWVFDVEEKEDLTQRLGIDRGLQGMGVSMSVGYLRGRYDVPAPAAGDEIAVPSATGAPAVNIAEDTRSEFAEGGHEAQAKADLAQFDELVGQLQADSLGLMRTRIEEVADAVRPGSAR